MAALSKKRARSRRDMARYRARLRKAGWTGTMLWLPRRVHDQLAAEATRLGVWQRALMRTAVEVGLRQLPSSLVEAHDREWRAINGPPMKVLLKARLLRLVRDPATRRLIGVERVGHA